MPPTRKQELELRVSVRSDVTQASAGMKQLAAETERAAASTTKLNAAAAGRAATAGGSGIGGTLGAAVGAFGLGGLASYAGPAAALAATTRLIKTRAEALNDDSLSAEQRSRAITRGLPFGDTALDYLDAFSGRKREMERVREDAQLGAARTQGDIGFGRSRAELDRRNETFQARARVLGAATPEQMPAISRATADGERRYQLESRLLQVRQKGTAAEQEAAVAADEQAKAKERYEKLTREGNEQAVRRDQIEERLRRVDRLDGMVGDAVTNPIGLLRLPRDAAGLQQVRGAESFTAERQRLVAERIESLKRSADIDQQRREAVEGGAAAGLRRMEAERQAKLARPETLRAQADYLEQRGMSAMASQERLGMARPDQRRQALYALQRVERNGFDRASPQDIAAAQGLFPEKISELARQSGAKAKELDRFRAASPQDFPKERPDEFFDQARRARNEATAGELKGAQDFAKAANEAAKLTAPLMIQLFKDFAAKQMELVREELRLANAQKGN